MGMICPLSGRFRILALPLFLLTLATPAWSQQQDQSGFAKEGGYLGAAGLLDAKLSTDNFDGASLYKKVNGDEYLILPLFERGTMIRGIIGVRYPKLGVEFSYDRTKHPGTFLGETADATFHAVNADVRYFFLTKGRVQPHILAGGSFPWLKIKDGAFIDADNLEDVQVGDATYRGFGVNAEAGVTVYPHPQFGIGVGYRYRVTWFDRSTGVSNSNYELRPRFRENSGNLVITGLFTF
jgi:outer membrane protein with beta-barrel domain